MRYTLLLAISFALLSCGKNLPADKPSGSSAVRHLSDYCPSLKNTPGDTEVYVLDSGKDGVSLLLAAGTHGFSRNSVDGNCFTYSLLHLHGRKLSLPHAHF
jgi:hypothetical protein